MPDRFLSTWEAAQASGLSTQQIRNFVQRGVIDGILVGKQYIIYQQSFNAWLERRKQLKEAGL